MYYEEIRHFSTDSKKIADNLGKEESDIRKIKAYLFEDDSLIDPDTGESRQFDPDCAIAQSWQRLMNGKDRGGTPFLFILHLHPAGPF